SGDAGDDFVAFAAGRKHALRDAVQDDQRLLQVGNGADFNRKVAPDFVRIDVDMDQLGWRKAERELRLPRAAVGLGEAGSSAEHDIGSPTLVGYKLVSPK